jgi:oxalate decarboxylase/phosphoglucose isomerase-like protein (cupin superfamily)
MNGRAAGMFAGGVTVGVLVTTLAMSGAPVARASATPGAVAQPAVKYDSKVVLENDLVIVKDVTFPPGVPDTGMHTHDLAHVGVILTPGSLTFTDPDGTKETVQFEAGTVGFRGPDATHMVANPGTQPMRVIEVELKTR